MQLSTYTRTRVAKASTIIAIFILLTVLLLYSDSFAKNVYKNSFSKPCILCPLNKNTNTNAELLHFSILLADNAQHNPVNILFLFVHADNKFKLKSKFNRCMSSLFDYATPPLHLHILTDRGSLDHAIQILQETAPLARTAVKITLYDVNVVIKPIQNLIDTLRPHFSFKQGTYYSDGLFYISIGLFRVMNLKRVIIIDADVKFQDDVKLLDEHFAKIPAEAIMGIAKEQQPVYRHVLNEYRRIHNDTQVGEPPPFGITGFNSGVLLLDLEKTRNSSLYTEIVNNSTFVLELVHKYKFKGHLGDQDFYTLISLDYPSLFYTLPCTWNRQLCQWWKHHGYSEVFNLYYNCTGKIHLLHGNCNSAIPNS